MKKLTQNDLWLLEVIGADKWTISELYRFACSRGVNLTKVDKSLDKLVGNETFVFHNNKYYLKP